MVQKILRQDFPNLLIIFGAICLTISLAQVTWPSTPEEAIKISGQAYWGFIIFIFTLISLLAVRLDETKLGIILPSDIKEWAWYLMLAVIGVTAILLQQMLIPRFPGLFTPVTIGPILGAVLLTAVVPFILNCVYPGGGETIFFIGLIGVHGYAGMSGNEELHTFWRSPLFWTVILIGCFTAGTYHYIFGGYGTVSWYDPIAAFSQMFLPQLTEYGWVMPPGFFAFLMFLTFAIISFAPAPFGAQGSQLPGILCHILWNAYVLFGMLGINIIWYVVVLGFLFFTGFVVRRRE